MGQIRKAITLFWLCVTVPVFAAGERPLQVVDPFGGTESPEAAQALSVSQGGGREFTIPENLEFGVRPMMNLQSSYLLEFSLFRFGIYAYLNMQQDNPGTPENLHDTLKSHWESYQNIGKSVGCIQNLNSPYNATVLYLGNSTILTAGHVMDLVEGSTTILWPDGESSTLPGKRYNFPGTDISLAKISVTKAVPSASVNAIASLVSVGSATQVVTIGYPAFYGTEALVKLPPAFNHDRDPDKACPILSPGVAYFQGGAYLHDCATEDGSSGSPVLDAKSGKVIGIHTDANTSFGKNEFVPIPTSFSATLSQF